MTKRISVYSTIEELTESAEKNAKYWIEKRIPFSFGRFGDAFIISPCNENGEQTGNASQRFFESHQLCEKFYESFRMVVAHIPGKIKGSRMGMFAKITFVPKVEEETEETARMKSGGMNGTIMDGGKE